MYVDSTKLSLKKIPKVAIFVKFHQFWDLEYQGKKVIIFGFGLFEI